MTATQSPPAVSVVVTVRNGERYVCAACDSLLAQTFRDYELIVVDDGSTDSTPAILRDLEQAHPGMRVITLQPSGISRAANVGIRSARAALIARMDADDIALPERLAVQVDFMNTHPEVVCVGSSVEYIDAESRYLTYITSPCDHEHIQETLLQGHCSIWHTSSMLRKEAVCQIGLYDESLDCALDLDLFLRMSEVGRTANISEPLQQYRLHADSVSEKHRLRQRQLARGVCERAAERRGIASRFAASKDWRPGPSRASRLEYALRYGWWAFNSAQRKTSAAYGWKAVRTCPWSSDAWRLLTCALCKSPGHLQPPSHEDTTRAARHGS